MKKQMKTIYVNGKAGLFRLILASLTRTPSDNLKVQLVRSLIVSCIALVVDFGMLLFLKEVLGVHYLLAATTSFCLGVIVSYVLSVKWVFATRKVANRKAEFVIFLIICAVGLALNLMIIAAMVQLLSIDYRVAKAVSTVVVFFWNFIARKKILY